MEKMYAYIRVSTLEQNDVRQRVEMEKYGITDGYIYADKISGMNFNRPQYKVMKKKLNRGDVLVLKSLDRLGRNYKEIQEEWRTLTQTIGVDIVVLDMPILDTRIHQDLVGTLISDIVLQLLSYVAQVERENIKQRQAEGIAVAKEMGKHLGRPKRPYPEGFVDIYREYEERGVTAQLSAQRLGITVGQFRALVVRRKKEEVCIQ